jgi:SPP1 family predicted phage head-tail adaptor
MNSGRLDRRVTIQSRTLTKDETGGRVETWATSAEVWAERMPMSAGENLLADAERVENRIRWRIRHMTVSPTTNRLVYQGTAHEILGIQEDAGRQRFLLLETRTIGGIAA